LEELYIEIEKYLLKES